MHTILTFQPHHYLAPFLTPLGTQDFRILHFPMDRCLSVDDSPGIGEALSALSVYSGIIFLNPFAVPFFFERLRAAGMTAADLQALYCVGTVTEQAILLHGGADLNTTTVRDTTALLSELDPLSNQFFLMPVCAGDRSDLGPRIERAGGKLNEVSVCTLSPLSQAELADYERMCMEGEVDCVAFFTPADVRVFALQIPRFKQATILTAANGTNTVLALMNLGLRTDLISHEPLDEFGAMIAERLLSDLRVDLSDEYIDSI
jgi:uroporphyrinogen-III synthase